MKRFLEFIYNLHPYMLCWISGSLTIAQIVLVFVLSQPGSEAIHLIGKITWWAGATFGWLPILVLHRKGSVHRGKSYVHTTTLVDTGLYAIVRHPQMGSAWMLMCLSLMLITQHWVSVALGVPAMVAVYLDLLKADQRCIEKFGVAYQQYMQRVPRVNFVSGIIRFAQHRIGG